MLLLWREQFISLLRLGFVRAGNLVLHTTDRIVNINHFIELYAALLAILTARYRLKLLAFQILLFANDRVVNLGLQVLLGHSGLLLPLDNF